MKRTRILKTILILLIMMILIFYVVLNYDKTTSYIKNIISKVQKEKVIIPKDSYFHRTYLFKTVSETNNFEPRNIEDLQKVYYTVLNNGWDNFTFYCHKDYINCKDDIQSITSSNEDDFINIINNYVSPFNSYLKYNTKIIDEKKVTLNVEKLYTNEEINKINNIIEDYLNKNHITKPTKENIEKIHDFIINNTKYDQNYTKDQNITDSNKATGALINKNALCSGYTDAFALFMDKLNIQNFKVTSKDHVWNAIYFDKKWHHIDLTWDDDEVNKNNNRNFFMINTKELLEKDKKEHNFNQDIFLEFK